MVSDDKKDNGGKRLEMRTSPKWKSKVPSILVTVGSVFSFIDVLKGKTFADFGFFISFSILILGLVLKNNMTKEKKNIVDHVPSLVLTLFLFGGIFTISKIHSVSIDLTKNKIRSISEETKKMAKEIQEEIEIIAFFDDSYEERLSLENLFKKIKKENNLINYKFVNPDREPSIASKLNARKNQIYLIRKEKQIILDTNDEEGLVNGFYSFYKDVKTICFIQGHGEKSLYGEDGITTIKNSILNRAYKIKTIELYVDDEEGCEILAIIGGTGNFLAKEIEKISKFKNVLIMFEDFGENSLSDWLRSENIDFSENYINDSLGEDWDPLIILASPNNLTSHQIVDWIDEFMFFPTAKAITNKNSDWMSSDLIYSGIQTWVDSNRNNKKETSEESGPFLMALAQEKIETNQKRIIVSDFDITNEGTQQYIPASNQLILSFLNWLSGREKTTTITQKDRGLNAISINDKEILKIIMLYLGLILAVLSQAIVTQIKRKRK